MFRKFKEISNKVAEQEWRQVLNEKETPAPIAGEKPLLKGLVNRNTIAGVVLVEQGVIQDVVPILRLYKVAISGGPIIVCTYAADATSSNFGVQDHSTLAVGTTVWVIRTPGSPYGAIFAVQPELLTIPGMRILDELVSGSNVGYLTDNLYKNIFERTRRRGLAEWDGSHLDSIPGEWVKMAHTGLAIFVDPFLVGIRANEYCGVWANYFDSLLRIAGLNYQKWTGGSEEFEYLDWNQFISYKGYAYNVAGQAGSKSASGDPFYIINDTYYQDLGVRTSAIEPETAIFGETPFYSRFPVHNKQSWGGVIGQGGLEFVISNGISPLWFEYLGDNFIRSKVQTANTASGFHVVQAEGGILFAKYPLIPYVARKADFDEELYDPEGKCVTRARYLTERFKTGLPICGYGLLTAEERNLHDIRNYLCNWEALAGVYAYINKFKVYTEKEVRDTIGHGINDPNSYWSGTAYIYMDPVGDIVLENREGARIELVGKNIRITAPGKIILDSGNKVVLFGREASIHGRDKVTLSAQERGITIEKDKLNLMVDYLYSHYVQMFLCEMVNERWALHSTATDPQDIPAQPWIYYHDCVPSGYYSCDNKYRGPVTLVKAGGYCRMPNDFEDIKLEESDSLFGGMDIYETEKQYSEENNWKVRKKVNENGEEEEETLGGRLYFVNEF